MIESIQRSFTSYVQDFIDKRQPPSNRHQLSLRNLYVFPSKRGSMFIAVALAIWVLGTNYQNNLILALSFLMFSLFVLSIHYTFNNLHRLKIEFSGLSESFAGEELRVRFKVSNPRRSWTEAMVFSWQGKAESHMEFSFAPGETREISLIILTDRRGRMVLPRMGLESVFPLGIIRCWTWLRWDIDALVFPRPVNAPLGNASVSDEFGDGLHPVKGGEDFSGLRQYQPGDSLRNIAWKTLARGQGLFSKEFSQNLSQENWLDFDTVPAKTIEEKLSIMAFWVLNFYHEDENFGLSLPGLSIAPEKGFQHRTRCLEALASY